MSDIFAVSPTCMVIFRPANGISDLDGFAFPCMKCACEMSKHLVYF